MKYLQTFEEYNTEFINEDLIYEKLNLKNLFQKLKDNKNKIKTARDIALGLLMMMSVAKLANFIEKQEQLSNQEKELIIQQAKTINNDNTYDFKEEIKEDIYKDPQTLLLSQNGWNHIRDVEKLKLSAYKLGDGMITIGYGHAEPIKTSKYKIGDKISKEKANQILIKDVNVAAKGVKRMFRQWKERGYDVKITQNQYDALVSIAYNIGVSGLRNSELAKKLQSNDLEKAAELIKSTGIIKDFEEGLTARREKEYDMFTSDEVEA